MNTIDDLLLKESSGIKINFSLKRHCQILLSLQKYYICLNNIIEEYITNEHCTNWSFGDLYEKLYRILKSDFLVRHVLFAKQTKKHSAKEVAKRAQFKIKANNLEKYGVEHSWQRQDIKQKIKATNLEKYGAESFFATEKFRESYIENCLNNYGVTNHSKRKEVIDKIQDSIFNHFGHKGSWNSALTQRLEEKHLKSYFRCMELLKEQNIQLLSKFKHCHGSIKSWEAYKFLCLNCHTEFTSTFANTVYCPHCHDNNFYHKVSKLEKAIVDYLLVHNIKVIQTDRKILKPLELDIYLPDYNMAFEIDGIYYHQYKDKQYHRYKTIKCLEKGINLYHLRDSYGLDKCLSFIKQKLNLSSKIYARNCFVKELSYNEAKDFFDKNHVHGNTKHSTALGLLYNDILVCAISYRKNKNDVEIARFASLLDTSVIGGFTKLLKHSETLLYENYPFAKKLISYCDRDLSPNHKNTVYFKSGFSYLYDSGPSLTFYKDGNYYSRQMFQKHKLKDILENYDDALSAQQNCINNKLFPVWNSGNFKYEKFLI